MTALGRLWRRAPAWRGALALATLSTGLALLYPVTLPTAGPTAGPPSASLPGRSSYAPPPQSAPPQSAPPQSAPPQSAPPRSGGAAPAPPSAYGPLVIPAYGQSYAQVVPFAGRKLPLPRGDWVVVASNVSQLDGQPVAAAVLAQFAGDQVVAAVVALGSAAPAPARGGFAATYECQKSDILYGRVFSDIDRSSQDCWTVTTFATRSWSAPTAAPLLRAAAGDLAQRNATLPPLMAGAMFRNADRDHWSTLRYLFAPPRPGTAAQPGDGEWSRKSLMLSDEGVAAIERIKAWGQRFQPLARRSFDGSLTDPDVAALADMP